MNNSFGSEEMLSTEEFKKILEEVFRFHTKRAPGLALGIVMVDFARELLGPVKGKLNAVAETQACLSDVIQVMTGCTIGNRYLKIFPDLGRFALTLYDREDGRGIRIFLDSQKVDSRETPELYKFIHRERDPSVQVGGEARDKSGEKIIAELEKVGRKIFTFQKVRLKEFGKPAMLPAKICEKCGESFLSRSEKHLICDFCNGSKKYYDLEE